MDDEEHIKITKAAEQYLDTLIEKYKKQVNYGNAVERAKKKQDSSRKDGRKRVKLTRRVGAIEEFQGTHGITGVATMLDKEWMSSEDEGPGSVSQEVWDMRAAKVQTRGTTILEVIPLKWRSAQVSGQIQQNNNQVTHRQVSAVTVILCIGQNRISKHKGSQPTISWLQRKH